VLVKITTLLYERPEQRLPVDTVLLVRLAWPGVPHWLLLLAAGVLQLVVPVLPVHPGQAALD
jgi:hypothetical protein